MAAECRAKGTRRAIANAFGDFGEPDIVTAEQILCDGHAPREEVFHGRQAHRSCEALEERRPRQRGRPRKLNDSPRSPELAVHLAYRWCELRIGQPAQQARRGVFTGRQPQRFDEEDLDEARE